jgi:hypothetical protein
MKTYKQWQHRQRYFEFVGPAGQIDPQGTPTVAPQVNAVVDPAQSPTDELQSVGQPMQRLLRVLKTKSPMQVMKAQQVFNAEVQGMLQDRSPGAARRGVWQGFNQAKQAKQNFGKQLQIPS